MRLRTVLLGAGVGAILVLAAASCGRYGKPVRSAPQPGPDPAEHAQSAEKR